MAITDEAVKKKHKEFNDRIKQAREQLQTKTKFSPQIEKLRQARLGR